MGIVGGTLPPPVSHPPILQDPKSNNHIQSTVLDIVTDSDIFYYPEHCILDTLPRHQLLPVGEGKPIVPP
jgi:hypothetical protein